MTRAGSRRRLPASTGFTLVEVLMAAVVMLLSSIGGTALFNQATRQAGDIQMRVQQQFAVSRDLASVLESNERYACHSFATSQSCSDSLNVAAATPPPDQDHYAPADIDAPEPEDPDDPDPPATFRGVCASGLLTDLLSFLQVDNEAHTSATLAGTGVTRDVDLDPASKGADGLSIPPHRYIVTWKDGQSRVLRQVQLSPTVAAWCP